MKKPMFLISFLIAFFNGLAIDFTVNVQEIYVYNIETVIDIEINTSSALVGATNKDFQMSVNNSAYTTVARYDSSDTQTYYITLDNRNLVRDTNNIVLRYQNYNKIAEFKVIFVKPTFYYSIIPELPQNKENIYTSVTNKVTFEMVSIFAEQLDVDLPEIVSAPFHIFDTQLKFKSFSYSYMNDTTVNAFFNESIDLILTEGLNKIYFEAKDPDGNVSVNEIINNTYIDSLLIFHSFIDIYGNEICQKDELIQLKGKPEGGWFTIDDKDDEILTLNPLTLSKGTHTFKYHYPFMGEIITCSKDIEIISCGITGEFSVCRNSSIEYEIENYNSDLEYTWEVTGGEPQYVTSVNEINKIFWDREPAEEFGIIKVTARDKGIEVYTYEVKVFIKDDVAEAEPTLFFGDNENRLLICNTGTPNPYDIQYIWQKDNNEPDTTNTPFYYFDGGNGVYSVVLLSQDGCKTSEEIIVNKSGGITNLLNSNNNATIDDINFEVFPNPATSVLNINMTKMENPESVMIYNNFSQLVFQTNVENGELFKQINIENLTPGNYFIKVVNSFKETTKQFFKN